MLALGRALVAEPKLLMLDEPSLGLAPRVAAQIFDVIEALHQAGVGVLLVEQNAALALSLSDRAYVLELGEVSLAGASAELRGLADVRRLYLGGVVSHDTGPAASPDAGLDASPDGSPDARERASLDVSGAA
jgi:branched-chain amino acid transport system ATP-binding protein